MVIKLGTRNFLKVSVMEKVNGEGLQEGKLGLINSAMDDW